MCDVKPGRWRTRGRGVAIVKQRKDDCPGYPWFGTDSDGYAINWQESGRWLAWGRLLKTSSNILGQKNQREVHREPIDAILDRLR